MKLLKHFFLLCYAGSPLLLFWVEKPVVCFFILSFILFLFSCFVLYMTRRKNLNKERKIKTSEIASMIICVILITTILIFSSKIPINSLEPAGVYMYVVAGGVYIFRVKNISYLHINKNEN